VRQTQLSPLLVILLFNECKQLF